MKKVDELTLFNIILVAWVLFVTLLPVICIVKIVVAEEKIASLEDIVFNYGLYPKIEKEVKDGK